MSGSVTSTYSGPTLPPPAAVPLIAVVKASCTEKLRVGLSCAVMRGKQLAAPAGTRLRSTRAVSSPSPLVSTAAALTLMTGESSLTDSTRSLVLPARGLADEARAQQVAAAVAVALLPWVATASLRGRRRVAMA
jgi:hypothetical protein